MTFDDCWDEPCQNGGVCTDGLGGFSCECPPGFVAPTCELPCVDPPCPHDSVSECLSWHATARSSTTQCHDECADDPAWISQQYSAGCAEVENGLSCSAADASGVTAAEACPIACQSGCALTFDDCWGDPCGGGVCTDAIGYPICDCPGELADDIAHYVDHRHSQTHEVAVHDSCADDCAASPCQNGGVCTDHVHRFTCECVEGFCGKQCEETLDPSVPQCPCEDDPSWTTLHGEHLLRCSDFAGHADRCSKYGDEQARTAAEACPRSCGTGCHLEYDDCWNGGQGNPCQNGGVCTASTHQPSLRMPPAAAHRSGIRHSPCYCLLC